MILKIFQGVFPWCVGPSILEMSNECEVVTSYNNRVYRIKSVHFDMDPNSFFDMRRKGDKDLKISHLDFWKKNAQRFHPLAFFGFKGSETLDLF